MTFLKKYIVILIFLTYITQSISAQLVSVQNVTFKQIDELIIVHYDLEGNPKRKYKVELYLSDDGGATFTIRTKALHGDVGKNIVPGSGKEIIWEMMDDYPNGLEGENFVFAVDVKLQKGRGKALLYILGAGAVGGIAYYFAQKKGSEDNSKGSISISIPGDL